VVGLMEEKINLLYNKDKLKISKYEDSIIFESGHHPKGRNQKEENCCGHQYHKKNSPLC